MGSKDRSPVAALSLAFCHFNYEMEVARGTPTKMKGKNTSGKFPDFYAPPGSLYSGCCISYGVSLIIRSQMRRIASAFVFSTVSISYSFPQRKRKRRQSSEVDSALSAAGFRTALFSRDKKYNCKLAITGDA